MEGNFTQLVSQLLEVEAELVQELTSLQEEELDLAITGHRRARDLRQFLQHHIYHAWDHLAHTVKTRNEILAPRDEVNVLLGDLLAARGQLLGQASGLTAAQLEEAPEGEWSIREILEHMLRADRRQLDTIRQARRKA